MSDYRETLRGIFAMLVSCLFFVLHDTMVKVATRDMPIGQVLVLRALVTTAVVTYMVWRVGELGRVHKHLSRYVASRSIAEGIAGVIFLVSLTHLPIANASAVSQGAPLAVTAASAIFLHEKVGWHRWMSIAVGFVGIMVIVRPGTAGFNMWALGPLSTVFIVAFREMNTRFIAKTTSSLIVLFYTTVAVTIACAILSAFEVWQPISLLGGALILGAGLAGLVGTQYSIVAVQHGDVSTVALFRYSFIPYAVCLGWLVWGEIPDMMTLVGIVIVIGSGMYTFHRERVRHQRIASVMDPSV
ncbi:DMT family transporter [Oryzibacter oryziterrae]|uniref:DMT family transporter n=1 Tax=Oryzibacter oryziterrae TaxID=2766474 RepID=UPI002107DF8E|nr:DMT family transporter [Oryzibacter oryziterrae]